MRIGWIGMAPVWHSNFKANTLQGHRPSCGGWCGSDRFWLCSSIKSMKLRKTLKNAKRAIKSAGMISLLINLLSCFFNFLEKLSICRWLNICSICYSLSILEGLIWWQGQLPGPAIMWQWGLWTMPSLGWQTSEKQIVCEDFCTGSAG